MYVKFVDQICVVKKNFKMEQKNGENKHLDQTAILPPDK